MKNKSNNIKEVKWLLIMAGVCMLFSTSNAQLNAVLISRVMEPESAKEQKQKKHVPWRFGTGIETYNTKDLHGTYYSAHLCMIKKCVIS